MKVTVTTTPHLDGTIVQQVRFDGMFAMNVREQITQQVIRTQDAQVRAALVALGWTPPAAADFKREG